MSDEAATVDSPTPNSYVVGVEIVEGSGAAEAVTIHEDEEADPDIASDDAEG